MVELLTGRKAYNRPPAVTIAKRHRRRDAAHGVNHLGRRRHMSTLPPVRSVLLWGSTTRRCSMLPTRTYTLTRDEVVELVRFKSLEQGYDPAEIFRNFAAGDWRHFSEMLEAYGLCAMLPKDDPVFGA
jgi:hypothetical protein